MSTDISRVKTSLAEQQICSDPPEESPFTCPICLTWLREPMLTSCGHRFCKNCIESWLERQSACCPIDNTSLQKDKDIFPDNYTRREISQQKTKCPNCHLGCLVELSMLDMESHLPVCSYVNNIKCSIIGCDFSAGNLEQFEKHNVDNIQQHLVLMSNACLNVTRQNASKMEESKMWDPPSKEENNLSAPDKTQELIRAMYERIIVLEQKTNEQDILISNLKKELNNIKIENQNIFENTLLEYCNGTHIWTISDFSRKLEIMNRDNNKMYYSQGFFTSPNGYRVCARLNLSTKNPEFLGLLIHMMQSKHDNCLEWPFNGKISLTLVHPTNNNLNIKETMMTRPDLETFQKPQKLMNPLGFGYTEFILTEELINKGFLQHNCLTVKVQVQIV